MRGAIIFLMALVVLSTGFMLQSTIEQNLKDKCCTSCSLPTIKYVSLRNNKCGEACIDPKDYAKIKVFEPTLVKADSNTPCADNHFTVYNGTVTHGVLNLKATLDMYLPTEA